MPFSVLLVDDSNSVRYMMRRILERDGEIRVCGSVSDGAAALRCLQNEKPDLVAMDLKMPGLDGLEVTRRVMEADPVPIIIVTSDEQSAANPFTLLEAGAVAVLRSPPAPGHPDYDRMSGELIRTIKALAGVKLVRRYQTNRLMESTQGTDTKQPVKLLPVTPLANSLTAAAPASRLHPSENIRCVAMGASTGGPQVLKMILAELPASFPVPILLTQHMANGFVDHFVDWLDSNSALKIKLACEGELILPGTVYVAPDDRHMGINNKMCIELSINDKEFSMRPSVGYMLRSLERALGKDCLAIILTGMGRDGASEMRSLRDRGAMTIAQNQESSLIDGMPGAAIACGGASMILSPEGITAKLLTLVCQPSGTAGWP